MTARPLSASSILVVGGGFAGLWAALSAAREADAQGGDIEVTLVSKDPYLTVRPRLYETDTTSYREPLAPSLEPAGIRFLQGTVTRIDPAARTVTLEGTDGAATQTYDRLVIATGSRLSTPPVPGLRDHAQDIDSYEGAMAFDRHLADVLRSRDTPGSLCFVVLGAGFAGLELALELRERIAAHSDEATAQAARIVLADQAPSIGLALGETPGPAILAALGAARIELRPGVVLEAVTAGSVQLSTGEVIETRTLVATTGLRANLPALLDEVQRDELGRLVTDDTLRVPGLEGVFAAGDSALARVDDGHYALMSCQHAIPMGTYAGHNAVRDLLGLPLESFRRNDYVTCLDMGRSGGLFTSGWDRQIVLTGDEAKARKHTINHVWISPPRGTREEIFALANIGASRRRTTTAPASA
jgi:NADH dehydrogenase